MEQQRVLEHEADLAAQRLEREETNVLAVDRDLAAQRVVEPRDEADERRLAGAGVADERRALARFDDEVDVLEHQAVRLIAERDVRELDAALEARRALGVGAFANLAVDRQQLADALEAHRRHRQRVAHLREILHRLVHLVEIEHEHEQRARGQPAVEHEPDAEPEHDARADGDEDVDLRSESRFQAPRAEAQVDDRLGFLVEPLLLDLLAGERLDDARRRYRLLRHRRELALFLLDVARRALDPPREAVDHREQERRDREADQRETRVQVEHHDDHADDRQRVEQDAEHRRRDEALDRIDVARQAHDHVAGLALVVERERQSLHVMIEQMPQVEADALRHRRRQEVVEVRRDGADERDDDTASAATSRAPSLLASPT